MKTCKWLLPATLICAGPLAFAAESGDVQVETKQLKATFDDGYLTRWENKAEGSSIDFGKSNFDGQSVEGQPYAPGVWWADAIRPKNFASAKVNWNVKAEAIDDSTIAVTQTASSDIDVHSVQWGLRVPLDNVKAVHVPNGVAFAAVATKGSIEPMLTQGSYYFRDRPALLSFHQWRNRFYVIETETGGLLIYCDDPELEHRPALEFSYDEDGVMFISNRSIMNPPWQKKYTSTRWVIKQFEGPIGVAVQAYQDYLVDATGAKPLKDRPTAWVADLAWCDTKSGLQNMLPVDGKSKVMNVFDGWQESIDFNKAYYTNLAKIVEPRKTMFYDTGWNYGGLDIQYPDHSVDPMYAYTTKTVADLGFHKMIHMNAKFFYAPSVGLQQFILHPQQQMGMDPADLPGVIWDALQNHPHYRENYEANSYQKNTLGVDPAMTRYAFNPAYEPYRYMLCASVLSAVRATGADMVHFDVPSIPLELRNERYGMNIAQGSRLLFKQIRETLDQNGFEHVAIACEISPSDPFFAYVDLGQNSRDTGTVKLLMGAPEVELKELQAGDNIIREKRRENVKDFEDFDVAYNRAYIGRLDHLGEPNVDAMLRSGYVQGYPHLGVVGPNHGLLSIKGENRDTFELAGQAIALWVTLQTTSIIHDQMQYPAFMDDPSMTDEKWLKQIHKEVNRKYARNEGKLLTSFNYGKMALVKMWEDINPNPLPPGQWERGDVARFTTSKGDLIVTRASETALLLAFDDGQVIAELDLFNGWKQADWLMQHYALTQIESQIDTVDLSADKIGTLMQRY